MIPGALSDLHVVAQRGGRAAGASCNPVFPFLVGTAVGGVAGAVVGTLLVTLLMQLTQIIPGLDGTGVQRWMLTDQLDAWQTLFREPVDWGPVGHAALVSALYGAAALAVAWVHFIRRDVAG